VKESIVQHFRTRPELRHRSALEQALARDAPALSKVKVGEFPDPWRHIVLPRVRR
jgi:hypothetical protein